MAEFMTNHNKSVFIKLSLFFLLKSLYLRLSFDIIDFSNTIFYKQINKIKIINILKVMQSIKKFAENFLTKIKISQFN